MKCRIYNFFIYSLFITIVGAFLLISNVHAQDQFTVFHYESDKYNAQNQNWDIDKDQFGRLFVANNGGLIVMDGSRFRLFELPDQTIIRSVKCIGDRVYTGSFNEFGYWTENENWEWTYHSLSASVDSENFKNDEFWKIIEADNNIYFQSFGSVFAYDGQSLTKLELPGPILFLLKAGGRTFVQQINGCLFELKNNQFLEIEGSCQLKNTEIKTILPHEKSLIIGTSSMGLFKYDDQKIIPWKTDADELLQSYKLNNGVILKNQIVIGTILKGILVLDQQGNLLHHIHTGNGLQNNTVLALKADDGQNLWAGLDKGFDYIWFQSPVRKYTDPKMEIGSVYAASLFKDQLYLGTNQGVYVFDINEKGNFHNGKLYEGSQGQVWFLKEFEGKLYCGHNDGTFILENASFIRVSDVNGGYNLNRIYPKEQDLLIQSTYNELVIFKKENNSWRKDKIMSGLNAPFRMMESDHLGQLILGHSISGLYFLQSTSTYDSVLELKKMDTLMGIDFQSNKVFKVDNRIVVSNKKEWKQWDGLNKRFVAWNELNKGLANFTDAHTIIPAGNSKYWVISNIEAGLFEIRFDQVNFLYRIIPEMYDLHLIKGYENIISLNDTLHLFCLEDGFALLNIQKLNKLKNLLEAPRIKEVTFSTIDGTSKRVPVATNKKIQIDNRFNNLNISFASFGTSGTKNYFRYKLEGIDVEWSNWTTDTHLSFNRLPPGNYKFHLKSLSSHGWDTLPTSITFQINVPWYLSWYAFVIYTTVALIMIYLLHSTLKRRHWRKQEQILREENERIKERNKQAEAALIMLSNEKLKSEITTKNMELAKNTMAMIKKNELLIEIKKEFEKQKEELGNRLPNKYFQKITKLIDNSLNSEHDWEMFESLFDQAHENFFRRLKANYPELTPSDFRLCAYLRMNLSSKEIAPLLNISIRGVEEKRYRLRKKLNLQAEQNLSDFIIGF